MKKRLTIILIIVSILISLSGVYSATSNWSSVKSSIRDERIYRTFLNNILSAMRKKITAYDQTVTIYFNELVDENLPLPSGRTLTDPAVSAMISQSSENFAGITYTHKINGWVNGEYIWKLEILLNDDGSKGWLFARFTDSGINYMQAYFWDNTSQRMNERFSIANNGSFKKYIKATRYSSNTIVYYLTDNGTIINYNGINSLNAYPYNTVARQGSSALPVSAFETTYKVAKFSDTSGASDGFVIDGLEPTYDFATDGYPDPNSLQISSINTMANFARNNLSSDFANKTITINGNTYTMNTTTPVNPF